MNQKGFTLIELVVAMAVGSLVMTAAVLSIYQFFWASVRSNDIVVALTDVNNAVQWIKRDIQMAQSTNLTDGAPIPQSSLSLYWLDLTSFEPDELANHSSIYNLSGTELQRTYDGTTVVIGRHITSLGFIQESNVITCNITAARYSGTQQTKTLEFSVRMRSVEAE